MAFYLIRFGKACGSWATRRDGTSRYETRWAEGRFERLPDLATELVGLKPDVILVSSTPAALAVKRATRTLPIVMTSVADPVGTGLVDSLARPGGNITADDRQPGGGGESRTPDVVWAQSSRRVSVGRHLR